MQSEHPVVMQQNASITSNNLSSSESITNEPCPEDSANIFSKLSFWWFNDLIKLGNQKVLQMTDLFRLRAQDEANHLSEKFHTQWDVQVSKTKERSDLMYHETLHGHDKSNKQASLLYTLHKAFGFRFYMAGLLKIFTIGCELASPLVVKSIISSIQNYDLIPFYQPFVLIMVLFFLQVIGTLFSQQFFHITTTHGMNVRTALRTAIYRKSLKVSNAAKLSMNTGDVINHMSIDTNKVAGISMMLHSIWGSILQIFISVLMLFLLLGWPSLTGLAILVLVLPLKGAISRQVQKIRKITLKLTGERIKLVNQVVQGIRTIKFNAWEHSFLQKIMEIRQKELFKIMITTVINISTSMLMTLSPLFVGTVTFSVFAATGNVLDAQVIFPALAYFNLIRGPASFFPNLLSMMIEARVSLNRIQKYLLAEEIEEVESSNDFEFPIVVENGTFIWKGSNNSSETTSNVDAKKNDKLESKTKQESIYYSKMENDSVSIDMPTKKDKEGIKSNNDMTQKTNFSLSNINLKVKKGDLVLIVGSVGHGKSSLLSALTGEMFREEGAVKISGSVAYVPQQAWIQNATVKDNILFGNALNDERYQMAIESCSLEHDLEILMAGDLTEIGEKGINLSGGQKQRVNLARAVYANADIYLFDDPLSALDQQVGRFVFDHCINGVLSDKTRIMVTHQWQYLKHADYIIVIKDGKIEAQGTSQELRNNKTFSSMLSQYFEHDHSEIGNSDHDNNNKKQVNKTSSRTLKKKESKITSHEDRAEGSVKFKVYWSYFMYGGGYLTIALMLIMFLLTKTSSIATDWFLAEWSTVATSSLQPDDARDRPTQQQQLITTGSLSVLATTGENHDLGYNLPLYIGIYVALGVAAACLTFVQELTFGLSGLKAAKKMHDTSLERVLDAPTSFFDTNPSGRIINRFSKDIESVDTSIMGSLKSFMSGVFSSVSSLVLISSVSYWFILAMIPILFLYYKIQNYYRNTSRELKRLDAISRSPIFSHFNETLAGISTIRAYKRQHDFMNKFQKSLDQNNTAHFAQLVSQRWLAFRLEMLGSIIVLCAALTSVIGGSSAALAGLSFSYALSFTGTVSSLVKSFVEAEANMNAVERILHYCEQIPQEAPKRITSSSMMARLAETTTWPQQGEIVLKHVKVKYRDDLDYVLRDLSFQVRAGEHVGVVGRTGCGKSTLMQCLFRMIELSEGQIIIDGIDISTIGLHDLRSKLSIIPQDPLLFSGTVRFNLDPCQEYQDYQLWNALEKTHMKEKVMSLEGQLDAQVSEYGENFSLGERQLFCVARAILRKTKILILDEATASIDMETDSMLQQMMRTEFADRTVLTVAHRVNTIIDSDRILSLQAGQLAEFDSPYRLLTQEPKTVFASLVEETGPTNAEYLKSLVVAQSDSVPLH
ncbi:hypothetical protein C9374_010150 [Naegleria lovaniensis]|uniref:Uncharacterized protein n=1 Tax=Naegleria lovaniensis TaxID=51637 RepID=A0AA88GEM1_NAELO|nr:uncharacterized protein C9374_010150 [Naegleria lovaniensis]KAG2375146.1 hypothetical protein C9374_010150 [Naegleria lovaniensis]